jgi:hypothetical protein
VSADHTPPAPFRFEWVTPEESARLLLDREDEFGIDGDVAFTEFDDGDDLVDVYLWLREDGSIGFQVRPAESLRREDT